MNARARGVALIFVLATIALLVPPCVALARAVTTARLDAITSDDAALAADLARGAEHVIESWLVAHADAVVLPPDSEFPALAVTDERLVLGARVARLTVVAWDETGLVPVALCAGASPVKLAVPAVIAEAGAGLLRQARPLGLDQVPPVAAATSAFPQVDVVCNGARATELAIVPRRDTAQSVGAWLGIRPNAAAAEAAVLNVNTARRDVLDAAFRDAGRGGLDEVLAARAQGHAAAIGGGDGGARGGAGGVGFVGTSDAWAFRIDVAVGALRRAWWVTYARRGGGFRRVQRLAIVD